MVPPNTPSTPAPSSLELWATQQLRALEANNLTRVPPPTSDRQGPYYHLHGRRVLGFCSNDYLGLASDPRLLNTHAPGSTASRLVCGDHPEHRAAEQRLSAMLGYEDAVLFPTGYQLPIGVLPALLSSDTVVHSDALNHACIIDGLRLSKATVHILPHASPPPEDATWWVCESIYSMNGDLAPAEPMRAFLDRGGIAYVDEAHAIGLYPGGVGYLGSMNIQPTLLVGTLGKAFGCAGAFIACASPIANYLRSRARSFVFSTGLPPTIAQSIVTSVDLISGPVGDEHRARLWRNIHRLADALGYDDWSSPIFPIVVGENATALSIAHALFDEGYHIQPIRPPTVPEHTARLRLTLSAHHTVDQIDALSDTLHRQLRRFNLSPTTVPR